MRRRTRRAVGACWCQMGVRISSTSALVTSETGTLPMRGKAKPPQARQPLAGVFPVAPAGPLLFQHTGSSFGEGGDGLATSLLGEWVPALAGQLAVRERLLPGLGQGDQGEAAESDLTAAATDDKALNPAAGSARLDKEVEAIAVGVSSGRGGAEERGRKGLWGMAALGLGLG